MNYKKAIELGKNARKQGWIFPVQDAELMSMIKIAGSAEVSVLLTYWNMGLRLQTEE